LGWTAFEIVRGQSEVSVSSDITKNITQQSYSFDSDKALILKNYEKVNSIKYTRDQLNGQGQ
jgi:hypothetical protein